MLTSIEHEIHQAHKFCNAKQYLAFQLIYTQDENMSFMAVEISLIIVFCFMCYFCVSSNMKKSH